MKVNEFEIPAEIVYLINSNWWPRTEEDMNDQDINPRVNPENVSKISALDKNIYFFAPPFHTLDKEVARNQFFWHSPDLTFEKIDYTKLVDIGDFGAGSDAPIVLDFRLRNSNPSVMYLSYNDECTVTSWKTCAESFSEFLSILDLHFLLDDNGT